MKSSNSLSKTLQKLIPSRRSRRKFYARSSAPEALEQRLLLSSVNGFVWDDARTDGFTSFDERSLEGVPLELFDAGGDAAAGTEDDVFVTQTLSNESGDYAFNDLTDGTYFVSIGSTRLYGATYLDRDTDPEIASAFSPETGLTTAFTLTGDESAIKNLGVVQHGSEATRAYLLDRSLNLRTHHSGDVFTDFYGEQEKWLVGDWNGESYWLAVFPTGDVVAWDHTPQAASGTYLTTLGSGTYDKIERIHDAKPSFDQANSPAALAFQLDLMFELEATEWAEDDTVRWLRGTDNEFGNAFYFLRQDGSFYSWDGVAGEQNGNRIAELPEEFFVDPVLLSNPQRALPNANATELARAVGRAFSLRLDERADDEYQWFTGDNNQFGSLWYRLDNRGNVSASTADGAETAIVATVNSTYFETPEILSNVEFTANGSPELHAAIVDSKLGLYSRGTWSYWLNWAGENEKWLIGNENQFGNRWYYILPTGDLFAWQPLPQRDLSGGVRIAQLDPIYHESPGLLTASNRVLLDSTLLASDVVTLHERLDFSNDEYFPVDLSANGDARTIRIEFDANFETLDAANVLADRFNVYLRRSDLTGAILLSDAASNSPLFSHSSSTTELLRGTVSFDGQAIEILIPADLDEPEAELQFQLLNLNHDDGSRVTIRSVSVSNSGNLNIAANSFRTSQQVAPGAAVDIADFSAAEALLVKSSRVRFDSPTGDLDVVLQLTNTGGSTGAGIVVAFPNLPDGVSLNTASGTTTDGIPYVNFAPAILQSLASGATTLPVALTFSNTEGVRINLQPKVFVRTSNTAPVIDLPDTISLSPGHKLDFELPEFDADNDSVRYQFTGLTRVPSTGLAEGRFVGFSPAPSDVGTYTFRVSATDGFATVSKDITVEISDNSSATTKLSGFILDVDNRPLPNVPIELGTITTQTDADGRFVLDASLSDFGDTLIVRGEAITGDDVYPFIAERLPLIIDHDLYEGYENQLGRPIYLPVLDLENGSTVDPASTTTVSVPLVANEAPAAVIVAPGSLMNQQGTAFDGVLSITEVPIERTPAALPANLLPDTVVTIQPGEMVFGTPAPLTLPNRANQPPGTLMDLWSINPTTGGFEVVGQGQVTADGSKIETVDGGIRNSSWHFFAPPAPKTTGPGDNPYTPKDECNSCKAKGFANSEVILHSGAYEEHHELPGYQSLGGTVVPRLVYNSESASPRPIVAFGASDTVADAGVRLTASIQRTSVQSLTGNHYWNIPASGGDLLAALQLDLRDSPSGMYDFVLSTSLMNFGDSGERNAAFNRYPVELAVVNHSRGPFGAGWAMDGLQEIIEPVFSSGTAGSGGGGSSSSDFVMLIDGNSVALNFEITPTTEAGFITAHGSPPGDFSTLERHVDNGDLRYIRTMKDGTVYVFRRNSNANSARGSVYKLDTVTDRLGRITRYQYDTAGNIEKITDPVGLQTMFSYENGRVSALTTPGGRTTTFEYNTEGDLIRIENPDGSARLFEYNADHRLTAETDQRGFREEQIYDYAGRITETSRADGTHQFFSPAQTQILRPQSETSSPENAADAFPFILPVATYTDPNGVLVSTGVDQQQQVLNSSDSYGQQGSLLRDAQNQVIQSVDSNGNTTLYNYDDAGNIREIFELQFSVNATDELLEFEQFHPGGPIGVIHVADLNTDGFDDYVLTSPTASWTPNRKTVLLGSEETDFTLGQQFTKESTLSGPRGHALKDVDLDGAIDFVIPVNGGLHLHRGNGDGTFAEATVLDITATWNSFYNSLLVDVNNDSFLDIVNLSDVNSDTATIEVSISTDGQEFDSTSTFETTTGVRGIGLDAILPLDANSDGNVDLLYASQGGLEINLLFGDGNGGFSLQETIALDNQFVDLEVADFDNDGIEDILTHGVNELRLYKGTPSGSFAAPIVVETSEEAATLTIGDINNDGLVDVIVTSVASTNSGKRILLFVGTGDGFFLQDQFDLRSGQQITLSHVNNDNNLDLVFRSFQDAISVRYGTGVGTFRNLTRIDTGEDVKNVEAIDVDADGLIDLVTAAYDNDTLVEFRRNIGNGQFAAPTILASMSAPRTEELDVVDIDSDGFLDIVAATRSSGVFVAYGSAAQEYSFELAFETVVVQSLTVADLNGDAYLDIITTSDDFPDVVYVAFGAQNRNYDEVSTIQFEGGLDPVTSRVADIDGDGIAEIFILGSSGEIVTLGRTTSGEYAVQSTIETGVSLSQDFEVSDIDGDSSLDLIIAALAGNTVLYGEAGGTFGGTVSLFDPSIPLPADVVDVVDINNDSMPDLVFADDFRDIAIVYLNRGNRLFQTRIFDASRVASDLAVADLDGDGLPEVTIAGGDALTILRNSNSQTLTNTRQHFDYEPTFNQLTRSVDELGRETLFDIDPANGNVRETRRVVGADDRLETNAEADDIVTAYTYTGLGLVDLQTEFIGTVDAPQTRVTDFDYDQFGRLTTVVFAKGTVDEASQRFDYNVAGNQTDVWDENGNHTQYVYDVMNRLTQITEPDPDGDGPLVSPVTLFGYDKNGNLKSTKDAEGNSTTNQYDELDRLYRTIGSDPDGLGLLEAPVTQFEYDNVGNLTGTIDPLNNETKNRYDSRNRLVETVDPDGGVTKFTYDGNDNLKSLTDPVGNTTKFEYDARDRLTAEIDPLGKVTRYEYDAVDNLVRKTDRNERVTEFQYDELDRLFQEDWLAADSSQVNQIDYVYDKASNLLSVQDAASALAFTYDHRDRVDTVDNAGTPGATQVLLEYVYDGVGNVTSVTDIIAGQAGAVTGYDYDALNRVTMIAQSGNDVSDKRVDFAYNQLGQYDEITRYSDLAGTQLVVATDYAYDDLNRLTDLVHSNDTTDVAFYRYQYDSASRISQIVDIDGATDYSYDDRSQLTGADRANDDSRGDESYEYDANGNRVSSHLHGNGYVTDTANRLIGDGTYTYAYDDEGNMVLRTRNDGTEADGTTIREFTWDHRNRLVAIVDSRPDGIATQQVEFTFDAADRRIGTSVDRSPVDAIDAVLTEFVYDREDVRLDFVFQGALGNSIETRYLHGPGIDQVMSQDNSTQNNWLLGDHLGTIHDVVDGAGEVINHIGYGTFGDITSQSGADFTSRYAFSGREAELDLNLSYHRQRFLDTSVGKWTSEDPIGLLGGINEYQYVRNDPISLYDPDGLEPSSSLGGSVLCTLGCYGAGAAASTAVVGVVALSATALTKNPKVGPAIMLIGCADDLPILGACAVQCGLPEHFPTKNAFTPVPAGIPRGIPRYVNPANAPAGTLEQLGSSKSPPVGSFSVDPVSGNMTFG